MFDTEFTISDAWDITDIAGNTYVVRNKLFLNLQQVII